jgi:hypothetical protein
MFAEILKAQHDDQMGRMRAMLVEAREGLAQLLTDASAAGAKTLAARRAEDEAALKRFSACVQEQTVAAARKLDEALAAERDAMTAAVAVAVAVAVQVSKVLAEIDPEKSAPASPVRLCQAFWYVAARGRSAAAWTALLVLSVIAGLALLWAFERMAPGYGAF